MNEYNRQLFSPPAPVAYVLVRSINRDRSAHDVPMLMDSGADLTLIPKACADHLNLSCEVDEEFLLRGCWGEADEVKVVDAELSFLHVNFKGRFPVIDEEYGILGRNVLNRFSVLLDGPRLNWQVRTS